MKENNNRRFCVAPMMGYTTLENSIEFYLEIHFFLQK